MPRRQTLPRMAFVCFLSFAIEVNDRSLEGVKLVWQVSLESVYKGKGKFLKIIFKTLSI